jgi:SAM-dependent methyltransferase
MFIKKEKLRRIVTMNESKNCCTSDDCCGGMSIIEQVKEYYGKRLQGTANLKCGCSDSPPAEVRSILPYIAEEIKNTFYGCGSPLPPLLRGTIVLVLGCGTGRDVYIASKLAGESGRVIGVDMTAEQIEIAVKYQEEQRVSFGYDRSNVVFHQGYIEDLKSLGIEDNSVDVVISNCVLNLSPNKEQVFNEIHRVLKPGGELCFSDVFADRRIPEDLSVDPVLRGECLGGAMYTEDFRRLMAKAGWADFRYTNIREFDLNSENIRRKIGFVSFSSRTVRAFKLGDLEDICEDYGQVAIYNGRIPGHTHFFDLDDHHRFFANKPMLVCGNTASMISNTRYGKVFSVTGRTAHFGVFGGCAPSIEIAQASSTFESGCC